MRTPLSRVLGLGSAKSGTEHFWRQRLTAIANVPLTIFLIFSVVTLAGAEHEAARAYLAHPLVSILLLLTIFSAAMHMRLGMQVIIEDYVTSDGLKVLSLVANNFFAVSVGLAALYAVLKLGLGS